MAALARESSIRFAMAVFIAAALHPDSYEMGLVSILKDEVLIIVHHHAADTLSLWGPVSNFWHEAATQAQGAIHINVLQEKLPHIFGNSFHNCTGFLFRQKPFWTYLQNATDVDRRTFAASAAECHLGAAHMNDPSDSVYLQSSILAWRTSAFDWAWQWYVCTTATYAKPLTGCIGSVGQWGSSLICIPAMCIFSITSPLAG